MEGTIFAKPLFVSKPPCMRIFASWHYDITHPDQKTFQKFLLTHQNASWVQSIWPDGMQGSSVYHLVVYFAAHRHPQWMRSGITSLMINGKWLIKNLANWRSSFMPQSSSKSHEVFVMGTYMAKKWISIGLGITLQFPNSLGEISASLLLT